MESDKKWHRPFNHDIKIGTPYGVPGKQWKRGFHCGDDFLAPMRTPVEAADSGRVGFSGNTADGFGNYVRLDHSDCTHSYYTHLDEIRVFQGDVVMMGQVVGLSGNSGNIWHRTEGEEKSHPVTDQEREQGLGAHCHFEVRGSNGNPFNPKYA